MLQQEQQQNHEEIVGESRSEQHTQQQHENKSTNENLKGYYSVFLPGEVKPKGYETTKHIFKDREEAMEFVRESKKARFRYFESEEEAINFATYGLIEQPKRTHISDYSIIKKPTTVGTYGEKISLFKGPKPQDLVKLRKAIENGNYEYVENTIWENPRYLVSSGDTPSILQEGFRYNALHVAAKAKNAAAAELILSTISNDRFVRLLYGDDVYENIENRIEALLDLYLNTPDKGLNETPLHFAVKFGAVEVVEVLVSFPQCDKTLKNKYGDTPDMIICDRCDKKDADSKTKKQIGLLLRNNYYVPVLRAEDNSLPPVIGEPFSPGNSPVVSKDPLSPRLEIHAYAGPMNKEGAEQFRKFWKTPPRTSTPKAKRKVVTDESLENVMSLRFKDPAKGLERLGHKLANKFDVSWKEYWSFLDSFIDITSKDGLNLLENYLKTRSDALLDKSLNNNQTTVNFQSPIIKISNKKSTASSNNNSQQQHHQSNKSTISDLCNAFQAFNLSDSSLGGGNGDDEQFHNIVDYNFSPFLCVEKACNVFANRIACDIINRITKELYTSISALESQAKQVEVLITSYMEDARFKSVNLKSLHYRLGELTAQKLCYYTAEDEKQILIEKLDHFLSESLEAFDYSSSDNENKLTRDNIKPTSLKKQMICMVRQVFNKFNEEMKAVPELNEEADCMEVWSKNRECGCVFHVKKTRKGLARNNSFKFKIKADLNSISKKLFCEESNKGLKLNTDDQLNSQDDKDSSDNEEFYTPPSSPSMLSMDSDNEYGDDDDDDEYSDVQLLPELFIEGDNPTKTDYSVFSALRYAECKLTANDYPNIYRWYHDVGLYSDSERESWPCPSRRKCQEVIITLNSPSKDLSPPRTPCSKSWLRITGLNSPKAAVMKSPIKLK